MIRLTVRMLTHHYGSACYCRTSLSSPGAKAVMLLSRCELCRTRSAVPHVAVGSAHTASYPSPRPAPAGARVGTCVGGAVAAGSAAVAAAAAGPGLHASVRGAAGGPSRRTRLRRGAAPHQPQSPQQPPSHPHALKDDLQRPPQAAGGDSAAAGPDPDSGNAPGAGGVGGSEEVAAAEAVGAGRSPPLLPLPPVPPPPGLPPPPAKKRARRSKAAAAAAAGAAADVGAAAAAAAEPGRGVTRRRVRQAATADADAADAAAASASTDGDVASSSLDDGSQLPRRRRRSAAATAAAVGAAAPPPPPPPPPEVTFSSKLPRGPEWACVPRWVVFSDLHVRESSLDVCLQVLRAVEAEAAQRGAGIMFLGDFWDKRGALPVEPLNRVLQVISSWRTPVVMLVGNHDQVDLGGLQHGLTPLELACPHVHVFEEPTVWHGALWLPYRRETPLLEEAMRRAVAAAAPAGARAGAGAGEADGAGAGEAGGGGGGGCGGAAAEPVRAIFMHADVRTAHTNQWRQAEEGLEPGAFPPGLPVYSGHYHLPHTVKGTNITYVGSPYQVSMNEASESKRLLVLEAPSWQVVEEIPLTVGPRHVRLTGPAAAAALKQLAEAAATAASASQSADGGDAAAADAAAEAVAAEAPDGGAAARAAALRAGDRVKLWLSTAQAGDEDVVRAMEELERAGVAVEQVLQPEARPPRLAAAEGLSTEQLIDLYCSGGGGGGGGSDSDGSGGDVGGGSGGGGRLSEAAAAVLRAAVAEAREAEGSGPLGYGGGAGSGGGDGRCVEVEFESVRLRGFGPFVEEQVYPLSGRGVRVIVGANRDEPGADSNGAGKTSLITAPLWALTGDVLARTESGGGGRSPVDAMRNDRCGSCCVALSGRLNGEPFAVEREVKRGKTSSLRFTLGGADLTMQDISSTAERIRRAFSVDLLRCTAFFGQNDITTLLEANDATLKQRLGLVVDLEIWEAARQRLGEPRKAASAAVAQQQGRAGVLGEQRLRRGEEVDALRGAEAAWAAEHAHRLGLATSTSAAAAAAATAAAARLEPAAAAAAAAVAALHAAAAAAECEQRRWSAELAERRAAQQAELQPSLAPAGSAPPPMAVATPAAAAAQRTSYMTPEEEAVAAQEEAAAAAALRRRQEEAAAWAARLAVCQAAASQALGGLRAAEASKAQYEGAVHQAAAATAAAAAVTAAGAGARAAAALLQRPGGGGGAHGRGGSANGNGTGNANGDNGLASNGAASHNGLLVGWSGGAGGDGPLPPPPPAAKLVRAICDRCRQPISEEQYATNVERLAGEVAAARGAYEAAAAEAWAAQQAHAAAAALAAEADTQLAALVRRRTEAERRATAEALAAAALAEREARAAAEASRLSQLGAWREAQRLVVELHGRMEASNRLRGELQAAAHELEGAAAACRELRCAPDLELAAAEAAAAASAAVATAAAAAVDTPSAGFGVGVGCGSVAALPPLPEAAAAAPAEVLAAARSLTASVREAASAAGAALSRWRASAAAAAAVRREANPRSELRARAEAELEALEAQLQAAEDAVAAAEAHHRALVDADRALGRTGIPSLLLDDALAQLQAYTADYLAELCEEFVLELSATKPAGGSSGGGRAAAAAREKDEINKVIRVRSPHDGSLRPRDVRQLSGGERRRVALALVLGFEALVRRRRRLVCNLMVLDEVLQQLDNTGCELVARVLRDLPHGSVLLVGQTNSSVTANFDVMDTVVKQAGEAHVELAA